MNDAVLLNVADGIAHVQLNRPDAGNSLDMDLSAGLFDAFTAVAADDQARVVLFTSTGKLFCGGGDVRGMQEADDRSVFIRQLADSAHEAVRLMATLNKPIITAVQGPAAGAGLSLVLLSDVVVAAENASFVTAYTAIGLTPDCGQSWLLPRAIGAQRALDVTLRSRPIRAAEARDLGIIADVVEGDPLEAARDIAATIAAGPAHASGGARHLIRASYGDEFSNHLDLEARTIEAAAATEETGQFIANFGRKPTR